MTLHAEPSGQNRNHIDYFCQPCSKHAVENAVKQTPEGKQKHTFFERSRRERQIGAKERSRNSTAAEKPDMLLRPGNLHEPWNNAKHRYKGDKTGADRQPARKAKKREPEVNQ